MNLKENFQKLSLHSKIIALVCVAALLPVGLSLIISTNEIRKSAREQQMYALNQGYNQAHQAVEDKMTRVHNISTLLAVNDAVNLSLQLSDNSENLAEQLADFENIDSYSYGMEMAFETSNILFYIDDNFPIVNSTSGRYRSLEDAQQTMWYSSLESNNGRPTWVSFSEDKYDKKDSHVAVTRNIWDRNDYSVSTGVLAVTLEKKYLEEILIASLPGQIIYVETEDGNVLASNVSEDFLRLPMSKRQVNGDNFSEVELADKPYLVRSSLVEKTNTYLVSLLPVERLTQENRLVGSHTWILYLFVCVVVMITLVPLVKSVTGRIQMLKKQMMMIQKGVIQKIEVEGMEADEIGQLIGLYNEMTDKVEELLKEQYVLGQEKTDAQLKALQSQINPHFLYNTLDMINWMAQKNETENIRDVVQAMSRFYRLTLSRGQDIVTILDEVKLCDAYMEIQRRRYKGRILYETEVDEEIYDYLIPKITLQPFLENAILHGINAKEDARGAIILNGWIEDDRITLSVTDDGKGMEVDRQNKTSKGSRYGMVNIAKRLTLFYGEEINIQVESSLGVGTCVIINIPLRKKEKGDGEEYEKYEK